ncbi:LAGLIDADG family homing endonuclease [Vibrio alginolyticus]|nr:MULTISPECIES: hypothetical protein [Vibrio]MBE4032665.1 hypothetical protein [Vibrio parahaemolyticus]MDW3057882.1 hypothetical protein [Vibrio sp. 1978]WMN45758.1 LAGLIDADG family homing endonuclease [Vibrio alginolyticus]HCG5125835.1 hypothetical protein [Vibrio parahaemolyticus]HCG6498688.1 hypothetical protein [Vibrio parahaemolyticus]
MEVIIVEGRESGSFITSTARTNVSQRKKLESIMKNLCACLGIGIIYWKLSSRGTTFYCPDGFTYQSATNTILELTEKLAEQAAAETRT